jgi:pSer/pThr/pTyr-binding forkhead associated (FHA) protein
MYVAANTATKVDSRLLSVQKIFSLVEPSTSASIVLQSGDNAIGRSEFCGLRLNSSLISRIHAVLSVFNNKIVVRDCNSTHGTFLNGNRITGIHMLKNGDRIRFAHVEFMVVVR